MGWYTDRYKEKNKEYKEKQNKGLVQNSAPFFYEVDKIKEKETSNPEEILKNVKEIIEKEEKKHKYLKFLIILIPLIIIIYLGYAGFVSEKNFTYFYDIGNDNYLSPLNRVSLADESQTYKNITSNLVYFNVPIPRGSDKVNVEVKFKDNFPENQKMLLGAKDKQEWHYKWNELYNPILENLSSYEQSGNTYRINTSLPVQDENQIKTQSNIIIATNKPLDLIPNKISDYKKEDTIITNSLRGGHTFYVYTKGSLNLLVEKQDINWYEGSDELVINLYDLQNNLIATTTIPDDGITSVNKTQAIIQTGNLTADNLPENVYKLEFVNFDGLIREIKINTNKIVTDKLFLADNSLYNKIPTKTTKIYTKVNNKPIDFFTYHNQGFQTITYYDQFFNYGQFNFYKIAEDSYLNTKNGEYYMEISQNDVMISQLGYFSFTKDSYFEPFNQRTIPIPDNIDFIKNNVDYVVTDYNKATKDNGWLISQTEFDIKDLYIENNELSFVFNLPHLSNEQYTNNTIPIDWIKINIHKPGLFK